jgi:hypothetical protein
MVDVSYVFTVSIIRAICVEINHVSDVLTASIIRAMNVEAGQRLRGGYTIRKMTHHSDDGGSKNV